MTYKLDHMYRNNKGVLVNIEDIDGDNQLIRIYEHPFDDACVGYERWCEPNELRDYGYSTEPECYFFDYKPS